MCAIGEADDRDGAHAAIDLDDSGGGRGVGFDIYVGVLQLMGRPQRV